MLNKQGISRVQYKRRFIGVLLSGVVVCGSEAALANENLDGASAGDIVVTALRRDTKIQETPLAISAVTGASLETAGTTSFTDLTRNAPSLRIVDSGPGNRRVILRGVTAAGEPTVGVYYDDAAVSGSVGTTSDSAGTTPDLRLFDVDRAEVLRGPQGTLYGSGSMGGTLRIIFKKPDATKAEGAVSANISAIDGGSPGGSIDAMVNLPVVQDVLAIRAVGNYNLFAGYVDNSHYGRNDINDGNSYGGRLLARFTPNSDITLDLGAYYEKASTDSGRWILETGKRYTTNGRSKSGNYDENKMFNATLNWDFGAVALTAVSTYTDRSRVNLGDVSDNFNGRDNFAGCVRYSAGNCDDSAQLDDYLDLTRTIQTSSLWQPQTVKNWSNEVRLSSTGNGPFNWTVGGYMQDRDTVVRSTLLAGNPLTGELRDPQVDANIHYDRTIDDNLKQKALFAELSYKFFDKLTLTAGTRWYEYKKIVGGRIDKGQIHYASVLTPYSAESSKEDGFVFKFNASYQANDQLMIYAQAAQGFRPGGVNQVIGLPAAMAAYSSDSLWNYEVGIKSEPFDRVYFNLAGYRIDWDNLQVSGRTAGTGSVFGLISNAGAARIEGIEAELTAQLIDGLTISGNMAYTNARLTEDQVSTVVTSTGRAGDRLANVPRWNASLSGEYVWSLGGDLEGLARADFTYRSNSYSTLSPTDVYRRETPESKLVNLRTGIQGADGDWGVYLYVNNLFDALVVNSSSSSGNTGGNTIVYSAPPRTFGLNLTKRF